MKKALDFQEHGNIENEAAEWLVLLDRDSPPTREERQKLQTWLSKNSARKKSFSKLTRLWEQMNVLTKLASDAGSQESLEPKFGSTRLWQ